MKTFWLLLYLQAVIHATPGVTASRHSVFDHDNGPFSAAPTPYLYSTKEDCFDAVKADTVYNRDGRGTAICVQVEAENLFITP